MGEKDKLPKLVLTSEQAKEYAHQILYVLHQLQVNTGLNDLDEHLVASSSVMLEIYRLESGLSSCNPNDKDFLSHDRNKVAKVAPFYDHYLHDLNGKYFLQVEGTTENGHEVDIWTGLDEHLKRFAEKCPDVSPLVLITTDEGSFIGQSIEFVKEWYEYLLYAEQQMGRNGHKNRRRKIDACDEVIEVRK